LSEHQAGRRLQILAFSRYGRMAPSSRYRMMQFVPLLRAQGIDVEISPLLDDWYMEHLLTERRVPLWRLTRAYLRRMRQLRRGHRPDLIWIEKEALPWLPWPLEQWLLGRDVPVLLDLDDSQFHRYDLHPVHLLRAMFGDKIDRGMAAAGLVTCGSPYIAERAKRAGAARVVDLPTAIDLARYPVQPVPRDRATEAFVLGWIGTPGNTAYLAALDEPLRRFAAETPLRIIVIGGKPGILPGLRIEHRPWSEAAEIAWLQEIDAGIMPLPDRPWERGKCGLKLLQYMASSKPAIASPVGVNTILVEHGTTGFLADNADEWLAAFRRLRADPALARSMGMAGRRRVEADYALDKLAPRLAALMRETIAAAR
jgi:glycosyltransferase involved in cell wall biosynthesis